MSAAPPPRTARLIIDKKGEDGAYRVLLNDLDLAWLLATDGLKVEWKHVADLHESLPEVTMRFCPDALDVELDVDLVSYLQAKAAEEPADV